MNRTLIIVDVQHDFFDPKGALYVPGGENIIPEIKKLIEKDKTINQIIFTVDWHLPEDCSFKENGGKWEKHCIQYSYGASISQDLLDSCFKNGYETVDGAAELSGETILDHTVDFFRKGDSPTIEEYGAFSNNYLDEETGAICLSNIGEDSVCYIKDGNGIVVCGLAGDYCVLKTIENLIDIPEIGKHRVEVFKKGIKSIDGGLKLDQFINSVGINTYEGTF